MISKSTKTKRRHNFAYHQRVATIQQALVDVRGSTKFYLLSLPLTTYQSHHLEARGEAQLREKYREMLDFCRAEVSRYREA